MNKRNKKRGFTLIELIVVIAILVALMLILVPKLAGFTETTAAVQCEQTRRKMIEVYELYEIKGETPDPQELLTNQDGAYFQSTPTCASGGELSVKLVSGKNLVVTCSKHGTTSSSGKLSSEKELIQSMLDSLDFSKTLTKEERIKYFGQDYLSNDQYRAYIRDQVYGGSWPAMEKDLIKSAGLSGDYVMEVCYNNKQIKDDPSSENVIIYAKSSSQQSGWNTSLIYNPEDEKWYTGPGFSINDKPWSEVLSIMTEKNWKPIG